VAHPVTAPGEACKGHQCPDDQIRRCGDGNKWLASRGAWDLINALRSARHLFARPELSYPFIAEHAGQYPVSTMCRVLHVSVSGYYDWRGREPSRHEREDGELAKEIHRIFHAHRGVYGSPRVQVELRELGLRVSRERTARLMREMALVAKPKGNKPMGTKRRPDAQMAPNLLNRDFRAEQPNSKWVSDTTSVWTAEGWLYVAVILDLFSRLVVGWAMGESNTEELVRRALEMALIRRSPPSEMLLHSDQGSPYTATAYLARLAALGVVVSMSRVGDCYDNAAMESFFSTLKGECVERHRFSSRREARQTIFEYIECFYNRVRRHSTLKSMSPEAYEQQMCRLT
jgi:putative transposase